MYSIIVSLCMYTDNVINSFAAGELATGSRGTHQIDRFWSLQRRDYFRLDYTNILWYTRVFSTRGNYYILDPLQYYIVLLGIRG